ncbi:MAG: DNA primase large subunit PriL [Halobacteriota archaeon]
MTEWRADPQHLCIYPFMAEASEYVDTTGITLDELISAASFERARLRGEERVIEALKEGTIRKPALISPVLTDKELFSYPFARILVSCIGDAYLVRRYALSEAKAAYERLSEDSSRDIIYRMSEEFDIRIDSSTDAQITMSFIDYLRFTTNLHDKRWRLLNRGLARGKVKLSKSEFIRVIQEAIYERIKQDLPLKVPLDICLAIRGYTEKIKQELEATREKFDDAGFDSLVKDPDSFPPCIKAILSNLKEGVNVTHGARFAVTAFLLNIGLTGDEVIAIYRNSPDFDEERTRYQVEHIAGDKGETRYTAPSCATMRTYGNCTGSDDICDRVYHPLTYYKRKLKSRGEREERVE